jgi:uncharacterized BrkB/YihY/UPF0761 family membrane protein
MMFKWLPDAHVDWRNVWLGAALTAALFEVGKILIGLYIGKQSLESTYGAAASLVVLLIWIYYSSQIVLMGAEFTRVHAKRYAAPERAASITEKSYTDRKVDPIQIGVERSPISAGWLLARISSIRSIKTQRATSIGDA